MKCCDTICHRGRKMSIAIYETLKKYKIGSKITVSIKLYNPSWSSNKKKYLVRAAEVIKKGPNWLIVKIRYENKIHEKRISSSQFGLYMIGLYYNTPVLIKKRK